MEVSSYSHWLHNETAFSKIQKDDSYLTAGLKILPCRVLSATTALAGVIEFLFSSALTLVLSPLYFYSHDRFSKILGEATDSAKTVGLAALRFFGLEANDPPVISSDEKKEIVETPKKPLTLKEKTVQLMRNCATEAGRLIGRHPNATLVVGALTIGILAARYFEYFPPKWDSFKFSALPFSSFFNKASNAPAETINPQTPPFKKG